MNYGHVEARVPRHLSKIRAATQPGTEPALRHPALAAVVCQALDYPPPPLILR